MSVLIGPPNTTGHPRGNVALPHVQVCLLRQTCSNHVFFGVADVDIGMLSSTLLWFPAVHVLTVRVGGHPATSGTNSGDWCHRLTELPM
jgi:hypothetical protein